jgi:uncharacterized PurR-regulated membrane protein YhhQ (DUF165 family)
VFAAVAPRSLVLASVVTYGVAEAADTLVYARLRTRGLVAAALGSNVVSSAVDSALFLWLAFGWTSVATFGAAQMIGKLESTAVAAAILASVAARACRDIGAEAP